MIGSSMSGLEKLQLSVVGKSKNPGTLKNLTSLKVEIVLIKTQG